MSVCCHIRSYNFYNVAKNAFFFCSYTKRVVVSGKRAKEKNPEVQVNEADPVIMKVIYKLKQVNQVRKSIAGIGQLIHL